MPMATVHRAQAQTLTSAQTRPATATTAGGRFPTAVPSTAVTLAFTNSAATADTPIWVRYAVGTAAGVGRAVISIIYVQRAPNGAQNPASA